MSKDRKDNKDNVTVKTVDVAETAPAVKSGVSFSNRQVSVSRITTEAEAVELLKQYKIPEKIKYVVVTEDKNVFYPENESSARNHAEKNNLKLFRVECQD